MERLRQDDTDTYWCGIEKIGTDLGIRIKVIVDPGKNFLIYTVRPWVLRTEKLVLFPPVP
jgi:hypothetical protein